MSALPPKADMCGALAKIDAMKMLRATSPEPVASRRETAQDGIGKVGEDALRSARASPWGG